MKYIMECEIWINEEYRVEMCIYLQHYAAQPFQNETRCQHSILDPLNRFARTTRVNKPSSSPVFIH